MKFLWRIKHVLGAMALCAGFGATAVADEITIFAAASLKEALDEVANGFAAHTGHEVTVSYAGSSALARQIEFGAPADVFISANTDWMDRLTGLGAIRPETRFDLLGNRLALIGPATGDSVVHITPDLDLAALLQEGRLAMALTEAVPAGIYGKSALVSLGLWQDVSASVMQTDSVRAALALVALGAAPLGIVYATDAAADSRVRVLGIFPAGAHPTIVYPVAITTGSHGPTAEAFLDYLRSEAAHDVFRRHGFLTGAE